MTAQVSVIVPTFNRAQMLQECVASLLRQTLQPQEIIVVDDGSTDDTAAVVHRMPSIVRYLYKPNEGKSAALNMALPHARGNWIWFFDDDDVALPGSIEFRLQALERTPDAALVISRFLWGTEDSVGRLVAGEALQWPEFNAENFYRKFLRSCFAHLNGALIQRDRIDAVGPFRTNLLTSEDYDFTLRVARGQRVAICDEPTFVFRQHQGLRGPATQRYKAAERTRRFAVGDAFVGRTIRATHNLSEYLGLPADYELDPQEMRAAVLARLEVMAGKGLVAETAEDAATLARAHASNDALDSDEKMTIKVALQEQYFISSLCEEPNEALRSFRSLRHSVSGRVIIRLLARTVSGAAWWRPLRLAERLRLAGLALRLAAASATWALSRTSALVPSKCARASSARAEPTMSDPTS